MTNVFPFHVNLTIHITDLVDAGAKTLHFVDNYTTLCSDEAECAKTYLVLQKRPIITSKLVYNVMDQNDVTFGTFEADRVPYEANLIIGKSFDEIS